MSRDPLVGRRRNFSGSRKLFKIYIMYALSQIIRYWLESEGRHVSTNVTESAQKISTDTSRSVHFEFTFRSYRSFFQVLRSTRKITWVSKIYVLKSGSGLEKVWEPLV